MQIIRISETSMSHVYEIYQTNINLTVGTRTSIGMNSLVNNMAFNTF